MTVGQRQDAEYGRERPRNAAAIDVWSFAAGAEMRVSSIDELAAALDDETQVSWADATGADPTALETLTRRLGLTGNGARHAHVAAPRPRLEPFSDHARAAIMIPTLEERSLSLVEVEVVITDRFLLFAHDQRLPFRARIEERAAQHPHLIAQDSAFLLFILLDEWLHEVEAITEELAFDVFQTVDHHHAVLDAMLNPDFPFVSGEIVENHYRDLTRRFERWVSALRSGREAINNAVSIFRRARLTAPTGSSSC